MTCENSTANTVGGDVGKISYDRGTEIPKAKYFWEE